MLIYRSTTKSPKIRPKDCTNRCLARLTFYANFSTFILNHKSKHGKKMHGFQIYDFDIWWLAFLFFEIVIKLKNCISIIHSVSEIWLQMHFVFYVYEFKSCFQALRFASFATRGQHINFHSHQHWFTLPYIPPNHYRAMKHENYAYFHEMVTGHFDLLMMTALN